jgi:hypothetical protein
MTLGPEDFWPEVLSEDAGRVVAALSGIGRPERRAALAHLRRMASEAGWSEGQARRARAALGFASGDPRLGDLSTES